MKQYIRSKKEKTRETKITCFLSIERKHAISGETAENPFSSGVVKSGRRVCDISPLHWYSLYPFPQPLSIHCSAPALTNTPINSLFYFSISTHEHSRTALTLANIHAGHCMTHTHNTLFDGSISDHSKKHTCFLCSFILLSGRRSHVQFRTHFCLASPPPRIVTL